MPGTKLSDWRQARSRLRPWLEALGWIGVVAVLWGSDLLVKFAERETFGGGKDDFRLVSEQITSAVAVLVMIPFVLRWLRVFPLRRDAWVPAIIGHTVGSVFFAFGHFSLMVAMRVPWYALNGLDYIWRKNFVSNLIVEYQKDIKIYFGIVVIATVYGFYRRGRLRPDAPAPDRLLVSTGKGTRVLKHADIDYLEAARNYVSVHAGGKEYVVRDTLGNVSSQLDYGPFIRTHRSFIVNIDKVDEVRSAESKQRVILENGANVPLSRGYRESFERALSAGLRERHAGAHPPQ